MKTFSEALTILCLIFAGSILAFRFSVSAIVAWGWSLNQLSAFSVLLLLVSLLISNLVNSRNRIKEPRP